MPYVNLINVENVVFEAGGALVGNTLYLKNCTLFIFAIN